MAIQSRRGAYDNFDPERLLPGEWAVVLAGDATSSDGKAVYMCFAAGTVKRMATFEDMVANIANANSEVVAQLTEQARLVEQAIEEAEALRVAAEAGRVEAESDRESAESGRADAETARIRAESGRAQAESARASAEVGRAAAESSRVEAESARASAEGDRADAESSRASAESGRAQAESGRESAESQRRANETARKSAETQRANAESARESAESARETAEAQRAAGFAEMEQRSKGWLRYYCTDGEYDPDTRRPIIANPDTATLYYVPVSSPTADNEWVEWMWDTSGGGRWEALGTTEATIDPVTTAQIDSIAAGESVTGSQVVNATGLTYIWAKIKAAFAAIGHKHAASDITSGTLGVARGGTGQTTAAGERNRLGLGNTTGAVPVANGGTGRTSTASGAMYATSASSGLLMGALPVAQGGTGATSAAAARTNLGVNAANVVDGNAISPASVTASGTVKAATVEDSGGTLAALRESVSQAATVNGNVTHAYIEQDAAGVFAMQFNVFGESGNYVLSLHPTLGIFLWNRETQSDAWHIAP